MSVALAELSDVSTFAPSEDNGELAMGLTTVRITGARVVLEWILRSWLTPLNALPWNVGAGVDVREAENASYGAGDDEALRQRLVDQALAVEYVLAIDVALRRDGRDLIVEASVMLVDGRSYPLAATLSEGSLVLGGTTL